MLRNCLICDRPGEICCEECFRELKRIKKGYVHELNYIDEIIVGFSYQGILKEMMHEFKFERKILYADFFSNILLKEIKEHKSYDYISYIPSDALRFAKRGFNQSKLIAEKIADAWGIKLIRSIKRKSISKPSHLSSSVLRARKKHDFKFVAEEYEDDEKRILLVDDILTTGRTLEEAAKTIRLAREHWRVDALTVLGDVIGG